MNRRITIIPAFAACLAASPHLIAQPDSNPVLSISSNADDSLEHGLRLLSNVRDNVLSFDDPAFYWFCRYVNTPAGRTALEVASGSSPASASTSHHVNDESITPIKFLLERPGDYRGKPVTIEGTLVAKWSWSVTNRDVPSPLHQCEIAIAGTRALAAVVTTESVENIPIRSPVRAKGYFIKVRAFQTTAGEAGYGPLLVARGLTPISTTAAADAPSEAGVSKKTQFAIIAATMLAAVLWLFLRRTARRSMATAATRSPSRPPQLGESPDDFDWMLDERKH